MPTIGAADALVASYVLETGRRETDARVGRAGVVALSAAAPFYPAPRNGQFALDRPITPEVAAARYNNFYEFGGTKRIWAKVAAWQHEHWTVAVDGLVARPLTLDLDDLGRRFAYEERLYRHRCVETWSMAVPWTGFPLRRLIERVEPLPAAR
jgi:sulfoxide reductase catalytic subunit YedY